MSALVLASAAGLAGVTPVWVRVQTKLGKDFICASEITTERHHNNHLIPLAKSGPNHIDNIVLTCPECDLAKGSQDVHHFIRTSSRKLRSKNELIADIDRQTAIARQRIPEWARRIV